jgi:tryptophanyl-tRNA synthetase
MAVKARLLTGHRPTGRRHLGHLVGTLRKWVELQAVYDSYFLLADWHALTTDYAHTEGLAGNIYETLYDWLAAGVVKRFGVVVRHHELGYKANAMVVFDVPDDRVAELGARPCKTHRIFARAI